VPDGAPDEVARGGPPGAVEDPRERDERDGEVGRGNGDEAEEGDGRGGVPPGPEVDGDEGEGRGEEGEVEEGREGLVGGVRFSYIEVRERRERESTKSIMEERRRSQK
jgi:hypothetical protein